MAEDLVEEDGGGAAAEDGGAVKGLGDGGDTQGFEVLRHGERLFDEGLLVGQAAELIAFKGLDAVEVHAVGGAGAAYDDDAGDVVGGADAGAVGGDKVVGFVRGLEADGVVEDVRELFEEAGKLAQAGFPLGAVLHDGRARGELCVFGNDGVRGRFFGEVVGGVLFPGADLLLGFDLEEAIEGAAVATVGGVPEAVGESFAIVGEGQRDGGEGGVAMVAVGVVLLLVAEPDLDVGGAAAALVEAGEGAELGVHADLVGVRNRVADEVGSGLRLGLAGGVRGRRGGAERAHGAGELCFERLHEDGVGFCGSGCGRAGAADGRPGERIRRARKRGARRSCACSRKVRLSELEDRIRQRDATRRVYRMLRAVR